MADKPSGYSQAIKVDEDDSTKLPKEERKDSVSSEVKQIGVIDNKTADEALNDTSNAESQKFIDQFIKETKLSEDSDICYLLKMLFDEKNELKSAMDDMPETMANMSKNMKDIQLKCNEMEERLKVKKALKDKEDKGLKIVMWIIFLAFLGISCWNYYDEVMIQKKLTKGFILHISSLIIGFVIALHFKHIAGGITNYYYIYAGILEIFSKM